MQSFKAFWESNYYQHPDLTDEMIGIAEERLKVKLSESLINLLKVMNGGYTQGFAFPMTVATSWANNHIPLDSLNGMAIDKSVNTAFNLLDSSYMAQEWGLPEKQVLLSGDGRYWITLDYRDSSVPSVRWVDVECDQDIHVADSFDEFLEGLVSEELYAED